MEGHPAGFFHGAAATRRPRRVFESFSSAEIRAAYRAAFGSIHTTSQWCPSRSSKLRLPKVIIPMATGPGSADADQTYEVELPTEIRIEPDQKLLVGVELTMNGINGGGYASACLVGCVGGAVSSESFWSDAITPPYGYGNAFDSRFRIEVDGAYVDKP
jgi:hypothetical protein